MLIAGAGGFARECIEILYQLEYKKQIFFFDDIHPSLTSIYDKYKVLKTSEEVKKYFKSEPDYLIGVGDVFFRRHFYTTFLRFGGKPARLISPFARIGKNQININQGTIIAAGSILTTNISIRKGCLINLNCTIGHDCSIGDFSVLSPGVHVSGNCKIGDNCFLGTGAVILPGVTIGKHSIVGAGAVVNKNVLDSTTVVGVPCKPLIKPGEA